MDLEKTRRKIQKELNAGTVSLGLLALLRATGRPMYGYEIVKQLESRADGALPMNQGAVYPALRSLERQGMVSSEIGPSASGPPRRYYRITRDGQRALDQGRAVWQLTKQFVDSILESCDDPHSKQRRAKVPGRTRA